MSTLALFVILLIMGLACFCMYLSIKDESTLTNLILLLVSGGFTVWDFSSSIDFIGDVGYIILFLVTFTAMCIYFIFWYGVWTLIKSAIGR